MKVIIGDRQTGKTTKLLQLMAEDQTPYAHYVGVSEDMCRSVSYMAAQIGSFDRRDFLIPSQAFRLMSRLPQARFYVDDFHIIGNTEYIDRIGRNIFAFAMDVREPEVIVLPVHPRAAEAMVERNRLDAIRPELREGGR